MPSKALLRPGQALAAARSVDGAAQAVAGQLDVQAVLARRDGFASDWDDGGQVRWLEGIGVPLARGYGRLTAARQVEVTGQPGVVLRARRAVAICTGSSPKLPSVDGLDAVGAWGSREAASAHRAPRRPLVLGGGVVGVEMSDAWSALGSCYAETGCSPPSSPRRASS
jgi:dihydrolipoamide dehydrogenase